MGPQQILRAAAAVAIALASAATLASAAPRLRDDVAIIDLGPRDENVRKQLATAVVAAKLDVLTGDGVDDALAGINTDRDSLALAAALADAQAKFGALACPDTITAAQTAIAIAAARQAAGIPVPELARAWTYVLLCADKAGDTTTAYAAATHLRTLGGSRDVDQNSASPSVLARYPEIDALSNREAIELEIKSDVVGADVYVDFKRVGTSPLRLVLTSGTHVIAAGSGSRRGVLTGTVVKKQPVVTVPMPDQAGPWSVLAERVAGWGSKLPPPGELEAVMNQVGARVALVRYGTTVEAWGHARRGEKLRRLGDDDGVRPLAEVNALAALIADRVETWNDRAPDPDQPLLVETPEDRLLRDTSKQTKAEDDSTKWWVYATIAGALAVGAVIVYANDTVDHTQRVELTYP